MRQSSTSILKAKMKNMRYVAETGCDKHLCMTRCRREKMFLNSLTSAVTEPAANIHRVGDVLFNIGVNVKITYRVLASDPE